MTFVLDRAGIVGADGPTHQGQYDISYMRAIPNFTVMAPKDEAELQRMLVTCLDHDGPAALRIPRGSGIGVPLMEEGWESLPIGRGELLREGDDLLLVAYGAMVHPALATATLLEEAGLSATVINARFLRPLDQALIHLSGPSNRQGCHHGGGCFAWWIRFGCSGIPFRRGDLCVRCFASAFQINWSTTPRHSRARTTWA